MPLISIITTTYKHEKYIKQTIESILSQTYTDWELLIGDDSPDDNTYTIIEKFVKKYPNKIRAFHHHPNKGIVDNMNFLISKVHKDSQFIAFLEGDDIFTSDNLQKKMQIFSQYPEVQMVYNNLDFIDENGEVFEKNYFRNINRLVQNEILPLSEFMTGDAFYGSYSSLMVRKNILEKVPITRPVDDPMYTTSDWEWFGKVASQHAIYGLQDSLTLYRRHPENTSGNIMKLSSDLVRSMDFLQVFYKDFDNRVMYKKLHLKTYISYLQKQKKQTIVTGLCTFRYSLTKNFVERIGMIVFSCLPERLNDFLYKKFKK